MNTKWVRDLNVKCARIKKIYWARNVAHLENEKFKLRYHFSLLRVAKIENYSSPPVHAYNTLFQILRCFLCFHIMPSPILSSE